MNHRQIDLTCVILLSLLLAACNGKDSETYHKPEPLINTYQLAVVKNGTGLIRSDDESIHCGHNCEKTFEAKTTITLTAYEDEGCLFTGWNGACSGTEPCVLLVNGVKTVTANFEPIQLEQAIAIEGMKRHLEAFADIALANAGHRAVGSSGYNACSGYVRAVLEEANRVRRLFAKPELLITEQLLLIRRFELNAPPLLELVAPDARTLIVDQDFISMRFSGSGELTADIVFINPLLPPGPDPNSSDDGCEPENFDGIDLKGKIAVIQRGTCFFRDKAWNAQLLGAAAVIIFNEGQDGRTEAMYGDLGDISAVTIPVISVSYELAETLQELAQTAPVTVRLFVSAADEQYMAENVFAETTDGNPEQIIMIGARLSSPNTGPGINDNGTGAAAVLELANQVARKGFDFDNKLRFAWWADDAYLLGSRHYADTLELSAAEKIALYLNADTIGSTNYVIGVYDGDLSDTAGDVNSIADHPRLLPAGTAEIEQTFRDWFQAQGIDPIPIAMYGDSAYYPLMFLNIPFGGVFTGTYRLKTFEQFLAFGGTADAPYDHCRQRDCDDIGNYHPEALLLNAKAIAYITRHFAARENLFSGAKKRASARFDEIWR